MMSRIRIIIKNLENNDEFDVYVGDEQKIKDVKKAISSGSRSIYWSELRLIWYGRMPGNEMVLEELGVKDNDKMFMSFALRGD